MNILALDVATKTGWRNNLAGGTWDFSIKRDESGGLRLMRFKSKVKEIIALDRPDVVVFERTAGHHKAALIVQAELHGVLKSLLDDENIEYKAYSASEIKKHATGKGNSNKDAMISSCIEKLNIQPVDDNHADACWIYDLAQKDFKFN
jgi:Holliday junction resolvasome RuvABC endonuclease subunit